MPLNPQQAARRLQQLPNIGPATAADLRKLDVTTPEQLAGRDPTDLYERLCRIDQTRHDPCVRDVFAAAIAAANGEPPQPWWEFSRRRKAATRAAKHPFPPDA